MLVHYMFMIQVTVCDTKEQLLKFKVIGRIVFYIDVYPACCLWRFSYCYIYPNLAFVWSTLTFNLVYHWIQIGTLPSKVLTWFRFMVGSKSVAHIWENYWILRSFWIMLTITENIYSMAFETHDNSMGTKLKN